MPLSVIVPANKRASSMLACDAERAFKRPFAARVSLPSEALPRTTEPYRSIVLSLFRVTADNLVNAASSAEPRRMSWTSIGIVEPRLIRGAAKLKTPPSANTIGEAKLKWAVASSAAAPAARTTAPRASSRVPVDPVADSRSTARSLVGAPESRIKAPFAASPEPTTCINWVGRFGAVCARKSARSLTWILSVAARTNSAAAKGAPPPLSTVIRVARTSSEVLFPSTRRTPPIKRLSAFMAVNSLAASSTVAEAGSAGLVN